MQLADAAVPHGIASAVLLQAKRELEQRHLVSILLMPAWRQALVWGHSWEQCRDAAVDLGGLYKSSSAGQRNTEAPWKRGLQHTTPSSEGHTDTEALSNRELETTAPTLSEIVARIPAYSSKFGLQHRIGTRSDQPEALGSGTERSSSGGVAAQQWIRRRENTLVGHTAPSSERQSDTEAPSKRKLEKMVPELPGTVADKPSNKYGLRHTIGTRSDRPEALGSDTEGSSSGGVAEPPWKMGLVNDLLVNGSDLSHSRISPSVQVDDKVDPERNRNAEGSDADHSLDARDDEVSTPDTENTLPDRLDAVSPRRSKSSKLGELSAADLIS
jgi:hypothetical protein